MFPKSPRIPETRGPRPNPPKEPTPKLPVRTLAAPPEANCEAYFCHPPLELELGVSVALPGGFPKLMPCDDFVVFDKPLNLAPVNPEPASFVNDVLNKLELVVFFITVLSRLLVLVETRQPSPAIHRRFAPIPVSIRLQAERWRPPHEHSSVACRCNRIASRC